MSKLQLRIAFDGRVIGKGKTGIGVYAENLLNALKEADKDSFYEVFSNTRAEMSLFGNSFQLENPRLKTIITKFTLESHPAGDMWEQFYLPLYLNKKEIDIFHSPTFHIPFFLKGFKKVVTIHDVIAFRYPQTLPKKFSLYCRFMIKRAVNAADAIIVPSFSVKSELVELLNVNERLIYVIPEAARRFFKAVDEHDGKTEIKNRYGLNDRFILLIGTIEPKKNIGGLIQAYSILRKTGRIGQKLVICGGDGWLNEKKRLLKIIEEEDIKDDVIFTGYMPDESLPLLYAMADLFVYPSIYEGFGLPPLEAMACGCPVIASAIPSISETVGEAGILADPADIKGLSEAILRVLKDENLKRRLREAGFKRVKQFSWEKAAQETVKVYRTVYEG